MWCADRADDGAVLGHGRQGLDLRIKSEHLPRTCTLGAVSKLTKVFAMLTLALWGPASMHCTLEALPGLDFLKTCCFADAAPSAHNGCESDGCGAVEDGGYRAEDQPVSAPLPLLVLAALTSAPAATRLEFQARFVVGSLAPPELPQAWQFSYRTALPPRAPSLVA